MPHALINVHSFLQDFNPSKFTVHFSILIFTIIFSLKLDHKITFSYWLVFLPLWIWKGIAFLGALVGTIVWLRNPEYRVSNSSYVHFKSMLISVSLQILLLMFEILVCDKLESKRHTWSLVFVPLVFISLLSISVCVWSVKNGRNIELEFFAAINVLQIILIPLKLDGAVGWSWIVVFIPSWVLLCFATIMIIYAMIFAAIVLGSPDWGSEQRRASINSASSTAMVFLPLLGFFILLTNKLDSPLHSSVPTGGYFVTCLPLFITLMILIRLTFGSKSYSLWWFGMRTDFCTYLLTIFPCLKRYGNTSFTMNSQLGDAVVADSSGLENDSRILDHSASDQHYISPSTDQASQSDSSLTERRDTRNPTDPKRLLHSLSQIFFRDKSHHYEDKSCSDAPVMPRLSIDVPD